MQKHVGPLIAAWLIVCVGGNASAQQSAEPKWTLGVTGGVGQTWDDEGSIGSGWLGGAYVNRRVRGPFDVEVAADMLRHERRASVGFTAAGHTTLLSAGLLVRLGGRAANVFVLGGTGLAIHRGTNGFAGEPQGRADSVDPAVVLGAGLSVSTGRRFEIAPLVRITMMRADSDEDPFSSIMAGVRVGIRR